MVANETSSYLSRSWSGLQLLFLLSSLSFQIMVWSAIAVPPIIAIFPDHGLVCHCCSSYHRYLSRSWSGLPLLFLLSSLSFQIMVRSAIAVPPIIAIFPDHGLVCHCCSSYHRYLSRSWSSLPLLFLLSSLSFQIMVWSAIAVPPIIAIFPDHGLVCHCCSSYHRYLSRSWSGLPLLFLLSSLSFQIMV